MNANMATAELLTDVNPGGLGVHPRHWTHRDGSPLTETEVQMVLAATADDFCAADQLMQAKVHAAKYALDVSEQLGALVQPYFDRHPDLATLGEIAPLMTPADRARLTELVALMEATN